MRSAGQNVSSGRQNLAHGLWMAQSERSPRASTGSYPGATSRARPGRQLHRQRRRRPPAPRPHRRLQRRPHPPRAARTLDGRRSRLRTRRRPEPHLRRRALGTSPSSGAATIDVTRPPHRQAQPPTAPHPPPPHPRAGRDNDHARRSPSRPPPARSSTSPRPSAEPTSRHVLDRNEILELTDYPSLAALARAHAGHRGAHRLLATMTPTTPAPTSPGAASSVLFPPALPRPRPAADHSVNSTVEGKEVDFLFDPARLIVETDSWRYHKTRRAFENDRARDADHHGRRLPHPPLHRPPPRERPAAVAAAIAATLAKPDSGPRTTA